MIPIKKLWHDPVWSKVIATGILGLIVLMSNNVGLLPDIGAIEMLFIFIVLLVALCVYLLLRIKKLNRLILNNQPVRDIKAHYGFEIERNEITQRINIGDYYDFPNETKIILKDIVLRKSNSDLIDLSNDSHAALIKVESSGLRAFYGGREVLTPRSNEFEVRTLRHSCLEEYGVFKLVYKNDAFSMVIISIKHINVHAKYADVTFQSLSVYKKDSLMRIFL